MSDEKLYGYREHFDSNGCLINARKFCSQIISRNEAWLPYVTSVKPYVAFLETPWTKFMLFPSPRRAPWFHRVQTGFRFRSFVQKPTLPRYLLPPSKSSSKSKIPVLIKALVLLSGWSRFIFLWSLVAYALKKTSFPTLSTRLKVTHPRITHKGKSVAEMKICQNCKLLDAWNMRLKCKEMTNVLASNRQGWDRYKYFGSLNHIENQIRLVLLVLSDTKIRYHYGKMANFVSPNQIQIQIGLVLLVRLMHVTICHNLGILCVELELKWRVKANSWHMMLRFPTDHP